MSILLRASNLTKSYGDIPVLHDVSLTVERGEFVAITGPSGSGKSTLLHILGGLDQPDSGSLYMDGQPYPTAPKAVDRFRNQFLGFVFQFHHLLPEFTAIENICMPGWVGKQKEVEKEALRWAKAFGIEDRLHHLPCQLSGGEQQLVAVARALVHKPKLLLADEPSGNLDSQRSEELFSLLKEAHKHSDLAVVVVTHAETWAKHADRSMHLRDGTWQA